MQRWRDIGWSLLFILIAANTSVHAAPYKLLVVSSYHREYLWEKGVQEGIKAGLQSFGFLPSADDVKTYDKKDNVSGDHAIVRHLWMDAKRHDNRVDIANRTAEILKEISDFKPDLLILGDDTAAEFIGTQFIDDKMPVVFYGMDATPLKYGLIDTAAHPGHNITGIYQSFYFREALEDLKKIVPGAKTFAVLSDDSGTGRAKYKTIREQADRGKLPMELKTVILTNSFSEWKSQAQAAAESVDAFVLLNHNTLKDEKGDPVDQLEAGAWYLQHIHKPDCGGEKHFAEEGVLIVVDDSAYLQGYEAMHRASQILIDHRSPSSLPAISPRRGQTIANRARAKMLGIDLSSFPFIEVFLDSALALEHS